MTGEEAKDYGLIDSVISTRDEALKGKNNKKEKKN